MKKIQGIQYQVCEWNYLSDLQYSDPFNEIELDALITNSQGISWKVPAFWMGGNEWAIRFAPPEPGKYTFETACTDVNNARGYS